MVCTCVHACVHGCMPPSLRMRMHAFACVQPRSNCPQSVKHTWLYVYKACARVGKRGCAFMYCVAQGEHAHMVKYAQMMFSKFLHIPSSHSCPQRAKSTAMDTRKALACVG